MSSVQTTPGGTVWVETMGATGPADRAQGGSVHAAIANAAEATGVDFGYLLAQARLESGLNPAARAATSSARGLYQFTGDTWLRTLDRHGAAYGLDWASQAIAGGTVADPAMRSQLLALRGNPQLSALMAGELANDNREYLSGVLGREPDSAELYLAHFLGSEGAGRFLTALGADPSQSAAALLPRAAAANRAIFFDGGMPRSVGAVMDLLRTRLEGAMNGGAVPGLEGLYPAASGDFLPSPSAAGASAVAAPAGGPVAREFQAAAAQAGGVSYASSSMADTLRDAFGLADGAPDGVAAQGHSAPGHSAPGHVRAAYSALRAMGM